MDPLLDPPFSYYAVYNIDHIVQLIVLMDPLLDPLFSYYAVYNINHIVQLLPSWTLY
jgi:hypothetical protein